MILGELVDVDVRDDAWEVLLQFHQVVEAICAPEMHRAHIGLPLLEEQIKELF